LWERKKGKGEGFSRPAQGPGHGIFLRHGPTRNLRQKKGKKTASVEWPLIKGMGGMIVHPQFAGGKKEKTGKEAH